MKIEVNNNFNIKQIADSGQCFRLRKLGQDGKYSVVSNGLYTEITQKSNEVEFSCGNEDFENYWRHYFDLDADYSNYELAVNKLGYKYIISAYEHSKGIRILNQEPFETLISFIISQRNNIPKIASTVDKLCRNWGEKKIDTMNGKEYYCFPTPDRILDNKLEIQNSAGLGYRYDYIIGAATAVKNKGIAYYTDKSTAYDRVIKLYGVGPKVANCYILFGVHDLSAFPIDKWMQEIIDERFNGCLDLKEYRNIGGILQQYMFYFERSLQGKVAEL